MDPNHFLKLMRCMPFILSVEKATTLIVVMVMDVDVVVDVNMVVDVNVVVIMVKSKSIIQKTPGLNY